MNNISGIQTKSGMRHLTSGLWVSYFVLLLLSMQTVNALPTVVSVSVAFLLYAFLWNENVPSVLFFALLFQWLAISIKLFYGNWVGLPFHDLPSSYHNAEYVLPAFYYSSAGLIVFALALSLFNIKPSTHLIEEHLAQYDTKKLIFAYLIISITLSLMHTMRLAIPGFSEAISNFVEVKWGFFVVLVYKVYTEKMYKSWVNILIAGEVVLGFASYFSSFKVVLVFAIIAFFWYGKTIKLSRVPIYLLALISLGYLGILWTTVKADYRAYLSGGNGQSVIVNTTEALNQFGTLTSEIEYEEFRLASYSLVDRINYLNFFSLVISRVPEQIPHAEGDVWGAAVSHIFQPRLLFPNKASIDDSEHTRKYSGAMVADQEMGASHSLGYMVDSYIDFGAVFMVVPIFLFGLFGGWVYKNLLTKSYNLFWGLVMAIPMYSFLSLFERNALKIFSQLVMYFLVMWIFRKFIINKIDPYLRL